MRLSDPDEVEIGFSDILAGARLVRVGDWHSHPIRDPNPSDSDLANWARHSDVAGVLPYAGLIVMPGAELGWTCPELFAWVTREDHKGLLVCEPGKVEG